jgi:DNA-binding Lrp family transcriptional regulator
MQVHAPGGDAEEIVALLQEIEELEGLWLVTGGYDLLTKFRVRDHAHLRTLRFESIWPIQGLDRIETFFSLGEVLAVGGASTLMRLLDADWSNGAGRATCAPPTL